MKVLLRASVGVRRRVAFGIGVVVSMVAGPAGREATAEAIHRRAAQPEAVAVRGMPAAEVETFRQWSHYLLAGPTAWEKVDHPPVTAAVRSAIRVSVRTDPGPTDPMVNFLLWKQNIDPTRFARYHPKLAPALHRIALARTAPAVSTPSSPPSIWGSVGGSTAPTTTTAPTITEAQTTTPPSQANLYPPAVPEPGMLLVAAGMTAWFVRRFHFRPGARRD